MEAIKNEDTGRMPTTENSDEAPCQAMLDQLRDANTRLSDALRAAEEENRAKSSFLSNMSHDIRTPMNAIMGMTSIALTHIDEKPRVLDCLQKIQTASAHLMDLVNDVLDMSRIASGRMTLSEEVFSLADMVHDITIIVRPQAAQKHQEFHLEIGQICEENLIGDPPHLRQTLRILQDEELQQKTPDLPWDRYIYMTHQQMASSISYNRENDMTPQDVTAVMESVHIVHSHRIQKAVSRNGSPPMRSAFYRYAIEYYCGLFPLEELPENSVSPSLSVFLPQSLSPSGRLHLYDHLQVLRKPKHINRPRFIRGIPFLRKPAQIPAECLGVARHIDDAPRPQ